MSNNPQINEALSITCQLIPLVEDAERSLSSAKNWSFLDVLGGGFIVDMVKHYKLGKASDSMNQVNYLMQRLQVALGNIQIPQDYRMQVGGFLTFADFFFDGFLADAYMAGKIWSSLNQVRDLKSRLYSLQNHLKNLS